MKLKERLVLVADDEKGLRDLVVRSLSERNCRVAGTGDGADALRLARVQRPELILLDLEMPKKNGRDVLCELRRGIQTRAIPVIMISSSSAISDKTEAFDLGADGYLIKPFDMKELAARVDGLLRSSRRALSCDALTRLPGTPMIEEEVNRRIKRGSPFTYSRLDIDNFGAFNKACGFERGDELLVETAGILLAALADGGLEDDFAGHMGGDDFVSITSPERAEPVARVVTEGFNRAASRFSLPRARGAAGARREPGLSIGIVSSAGRKIEHYAKAVEISAELLRYLKGRKCGCRSAYLLDQRRGPDSDGAKNAVRSTASRVFNF